MEISFWIQESSIADHLSLKRIISYNPLPSPRLICHSLFLFLLLLLLFLSFPIIILLLHLLFPPIHSRSRVPSPFFFPSLYIDSSRGCLNSRLPFPSQTVHSLHRYLSPTSSSQNVQKTLHLPIPSTIKTFLSIHPCEFQTGTTRTTPAKLASLGPRK